MGSGLTGVSSLDTSASIKSIGDTYKKCRINSMKPTFLAFHHRTSKNYRDLQREQEKREVFHLAESWICQKIWIEELKSWRVDHRDTLYIFLLGSLVCFHRFHLLVPREIDTSISILPTLIRKNGDIKCDAEYICEGWYFPNLLFSHLLSTRHYLSWIDRGSFVFNGWQCPSSMEWRGWFLEFNRGWVGWETLTDLNSGHEELDR